MRPASPCYPVDRYMVESSKKFEFVNILDDEIWQPEPALRPEDEIILRKLHEMLQSTADDLKALSGELSKFHNPGIQIKTQPMPLDEEFNEKVHIEEVVNAKFHGHKIIEKPSPPLMIQPKKLKNSTSFVKPTTKIVSNTGIQVNTIPTKKNVKQKNLSVTHTKCVQINSAGTSNGKTNNETRNKPAISYNEYIFKYEEPRNIVEKCKKLQIQDMPSINIRTELKEQKVLQLDIYPEVYDDKKNTNTNNPNVAVIAMDHDTIESKKTTMPEPAFNAHESSHNKQDTYVNKPPVRKVSKMSIYDSSGSTDPSSDTVQKIKASQKIKSMLKRSPKISARYNVKDDKKKGIEKQLHLEEWRKKLNLVYGPSTSKSNKPVGKSRSGSKIISEKSKVKQTPSKTKGKHSMNNAEYIPYNQLTLGGARVSDIEREISNIPHNGNIRLSPILDKILSSRENSCSKNNSSKKHKKKDSPKILTTSDENLLEEVLNIENKISETVSNNEKLSKTVLKQNSDDNYSDKNDIYDDDFEDDKTDVPPEDDEQLSNEQSDNSNSNKSIDEPNNSDKSIKNKNCRNKNHTTNTKKTFVIPNLTLKNSVDIFEFVHAIETQDTATQSNTTHKISLKETQTSPRNDKSRPLQPIHNDLWPSNEPKREYFDPKGEIEQLFKVEKDLIRKIIIEEYGDLIESNISKPSTSKEVKTVERDKNMYSYQKNTQTSPAHVKSVMTSPKSTKTRTTSPFLSVAVDHKTSPTVLVTNEKAINISEDEADGISINLSSPKFSLRLPQSSSEVLSNFDCNLSLGSHDKENQNTKRTNKTSEKSDTKQSKTHRIIKVNQATNTLYTKFRNSSSSNSADVEKSSSDISSLGEVKLKINRKNKNNRVTSSSESSSSSSSSKTDTSIGGIIPLRSEGEVSQEQNNSRKLKSEGEISLEPFL